MCNDDEAFRVTLDVSSYSPDEITVKTKNNRIVVHAKHRERQDEFGYIEREFKRQYVLPKVKLSEPRCDSTIFASQGY